MLTTQEELLDYTPYVIPDYQKSVYKTIGGTPHLDMSYTVFGEVVEGMDVVDAISDVETDDRNRPLGDVVIKMRIVRR
jgi:peptidyl-prolyl cis-trans isomerase B (cyclophilin B)